MYQIPIPPANLAQEVFNYLFQVQQVLNLQLQELDAAVYVTEGGKTTSAAQLYKRGTGVSAQTVEDLRIRCVNLQKDLDALSADVSRLAQEVQTVSGTVGGLSEDLDATDSRVDELMQDMDSLAQSVGALSASVQGLPDVLYPVGSVYTAAVNTAPAFGTWEALEGAAEGLYQWKRVS